MQQVADRAQAELQKTGATWIATTDYRTYAMLRWYFNGRVPVIQINERGRFMGFRDPGMNSVAGHAGLYVAREPDDGSPVWAIDDGGQGAARAGRAELARGRDGYLCAGKVDRLDAGAFAAAGFAAVSVARVGGRSPSGIAGLRASGNSPPHPKLALTRPHRACAAGLWRGRPAPAAAAP